MTKRDEIINLTSNIKGAIEALDKLEPGNGDGTKETYARLQQEAEMHKGVLLASGIALLAIVIMDINRIADALDAPDEGQLLKQRPSFDPE